MKDISQFYSECLVVNALSSDGFIKTADSGLVMSLIDKVKQYVGGRIDPNDRTGSLINLLGPGVISVTLKGFGMGWISTLVGLAVSVFHIDLASIVRSIWSTLTPKISNDSKVSSSEVRAAVTEAVQSNSGSNEDVTKTSHSKLIRDANFIKISMKEKNITKNAGFLSSKTNFIGILTSVLSWIFNVAIASAGLMVAGDVVNKFVGRPNAIDGTLVGGKPKEEVAVPQFVSKQKVFPINKSYSEEKYNLGSSDWTVNIRNDDSSIENMLISFTKEVYDNLDGKENLIRSSPAFKVVKDRISWYNHASPGSPIVWIPKDLSSKKQIVDYFIDDVAERYGKNIT